MDLKKVLDSKRIQELKKELKIKYPYGTAGFRYNNGIILDDLAFPIGECLGYLSMFTNKSFGIMITASHNPIDDNGVKIIGEDGEMISNDFEEYITLFCNSREMKVELVKELELLSKNVKKNGLERPIIHIGYDTRPSSIPILELIEDGLVSAFPFIEINEMGLVSTPMAHYNMIYSNQYIFNNTIYFRKWLSDMESDETLLVDCANGVGGPVFSLLYNNLKHNIHCNLRNTAESSIQIQYLNHECGSEYAQKERKLPMGFSKNYDHSHRIAHFDGDADRLVYTMYDNERDIYHLMDGDKIGVLMTLFIQKELEILDDFNYQTKIGFIQTAYANGASTEYVKNKLKVETKYAATGVKNLHHLAKEYDIGVYFEANGHGTVLFSKKWLEHLDKYYRDLCLRKCNLEDEEFLNKVYSVNNLYYMSKLISQFTGDAITNLLVVEGILYKYGLSTQNWIDLYGEKPNILWKLEVPDKSIFKACDDETKLIEPITFQEEIDKIMEYYSRVNARCFVRPSGTENCVRVYCEADNIEAVKDIQIKMNRLFKEIN